mmetsp:Transcript_32162/g.68852  ORF Transcript_32162/g.68852 Transcript_32162/m.68852 type:complete len:207 (+) Transcript_32162:375-995(+)
MSLRSITSLSLSARISESSPNSSGVPSSPSSWALDPDPDPSPKPSWAGNCMCIAADAAVTVGAAGAAAVAVAAWPSRIGTAARPASALGSGMARVGPAPAPPPIRSSSRRAPAKTEVAVELLPTPPMAAVVLADVAEAPATLFVDLGKEPSPEFWRLRISDTTSPMSTPASSSSMLARTWTTCFSTTVSERSWRQARRQTTILRTC